MKKSSLQLFKHQQSGSALTGLTNWTFVYWTGESENNHFEWAARDHLVQFSVPLTSRYSRLYHYHSVTILLIWIIMQALPQSPFFHCRHFLSCHNRITTSVTDNIYTGCTPLDLFPVQGKVIHNTAGAIVRHFNDTWAFPVMTHYIQQLCRVQHDVFRLLILSNQQSKTLNVHNPYRAQSCLPPEASWFDECELERDYTSRPLKKNNDIACLSILGEGGQTCRILCGSSWGLFHLHVKCFFPYITFFLS